MEKIKLLLPIIAVMTFLGIGNVSAQEEKNPQTVIIQVYGESKGSEIDLSLLVTAPAGDSYEVPLGTRTLKNKKEFIINHSKILQKEIDKWKKEGFIVDDVSTIYIDSLVIIMSKN